MPDGFPEFPVPEPFYVITASGQGTEGQAVLALDMGWEKVRDFYLAELPNAGWENIDEQSTDEGTEITATKDGVQGNVSLSGDSGAADLALNIFTLR